MDRIKIIKQSDEVLEITRTDQANKSDKLNTKLFLIGLGVLSLPFMIYFLNKDKFDYMIFIFLALMLVFLIPLIKQYNKINNRIKNDQIIRFNKTDSTIILNNEQTRSFEDLRSTLIEHNYIDGDPNGYTLKLDFDSNEKFEIDQSSNKNEIYALAAMIHIITKKRIRKLNK